jgi:hypothetical protein
VAGLDTGKRAELVDIVNFTARVHDERNDQAVETQNFRENENENLKREWLTLGSRVTGVLNQPFRRTDGAVGLFHGHRRHQRFQ